MWMHWARAGGGPSLVAGVSSGKRNQIPLCLWSTASDGSVQVVWVRGGESGGIVKKSRERWCEERRTDKAKAEAKISTEAYSGQDTGCRAWEPPICVESRQHAWVTPNTRVSRRRVQDAC